MLENFRTKIIRSITGAVRFCPKLPTNERPKILTIRETQPAIQQTIFHQAEWPSDSVSLTQ